VRNAEAQRLLTLILHLVLGFLQFRFAQNVVATRLITSHDQNSPWHVLREYEAQKWDKKDLAFWIALPTYEFEDAILSASGLWAHNTRTERYEIMRDGV
jgi:hypothetical protein